MGPELVVMCGLSRTDVAAVAETARQHRPTGAVVVAHDLRGLGEGVVRREVTDEAGTRRRTLELAHGCVSCTLTQDLLPLLLELAADPTLRRVLLVLDPAMGPEAACSALAEIVPEGAGGPVTDAYHLRGVVGVLDGPRWLDDAGGGEDLADRGLAVAADDDRTVAQLVVEHAEFADVHVVTGSAPQPWDRVRRDAVLARLAPTAVRADDDPLAALARAHPEARRGVPDDPHGRLLRGQPPLSRDAGVSLLHVGLRRPFHPTRLHDAFDVLLTGTVRIRGRAWVASQPDHALWLESAGGALQIGQVGRWLAAAEPAAWDEVEPERAAAAALRWDPEFGDREQQLVALVHDADPVTVVAALDGALLTDEELAEGEAVWRTWDDPFGVWHADPCDELSVAEIEALDRGERS